MKQYVKIGLAVCLAGLVVLALCYRKTILLVYRSVRAFDEENLAHSFQTMYEIQPSVKIKKGETVSEFEYDLRPLMETFQFRGRQMSVKDFLEETKPPACLWQQMIKSSLNNIFWAQTKQSAFLLTLSANLLFRRWLGLL